MQDRRLTCEQVKRFLAYLHALPAEDEPSSREDIETNLTRKELNVHLSSCDDCRKVFAEDLVLIKSIVGLEQFAPPGIAASAVKLARRRLLKQSFIKWTLVVIGVSLISIALEHQFTIVFQGLSRLARVLASRIDLTLAKGLLSAFEAVFRAITKIISIGKMGEEIFTLRHEAFILFVATGAIVLMIMYGFGIVLRGRKEARP